MIALYFLCLAAFYGWMVKAAVPREERAATHPAVRLEVVTGGAAFTVLDGGLAEPDQDQRAA